MLLRCPCLADARLRLTGNIFIRPEQLRHSGLVNCDTRNSLWSYRPAPAGPEGNNNKTNDNDDDDDRDHGLNISGDPHVTAAIGY